MPISSVCQATSCMDPKVSERSTSGRDIQERIEPIIYGGGQQDGLRSGTVPVPLCVGMSTASGILNTNEGSEERGRVAKHRDRFIELLQNSAFPVAINGPTSNCRHPSNINIQFRGFSAQDILGSLQLG